MVSNPARGQLNRKSYIFPVCLSAPVNLVLLGRSGRPPRIRNRSLLFVALWNTAAGWRQHCLCTVVVSLYSSACTTPESVYRLQRGTCRTVHPVVYCLCCTICMLHKHSIACFCMFSTDTVKAHINWYMVTFQGSTCLELSLRFTGPVPADSRQ